MPSIPEDWKEAPDTDPYLLRIRTLLECEGELHMLTLARMWLEKLAEVGLHEADHASKAVAKEPGSYRPRAEPLHTGIYPIRLEGSREVVFIKLNSFRSEHGYKALEILDSPLRTDKAILAALTVLEARQLERPSRMEDSLVREALDLRRYWSEPPDDQDMPEVEKEPRYSTLEELSLLEEPEVLLYQLKKVGPIPTLEFVVAILRHYRPEFDELPREEQVSLVKAGCERVNNFLKALNHLVSFLEYGAAGKKLASSREDAARDMRAAELQDVERLTAPKLGDLLGIEKPKSDKDRRTNSTANDIAKRGRRLLVNNLGEEFWSKAVEAKKEERQRHSSLSEEEQAIEWLAEELGITCEQAWDLIERARSRQKTDEVG
jgi:hypothetical protein